MIRQEVKVRLKWVVLVKALVSRLHNPKQLLQLYLGLFNYH